MRTKRYLSFLLVLMLIFSSTFSVAAKENRKDRINEYLNSAEEVNMHPEKPEKLQLVPENLYDENEDVRVVVQLKDEPAISYLRTMEKYSELSETERVSLENDVISTQGSVQRDLSNEGISVKIENSMTVAANAFSTIVKASDIDKIKENPRVKGVFISNEYKRPETPQMLTSHDMIGSNYTWNTLGYKGEGMVVAIVDTGIDPLHKDMNISDGIEVKLSEREVQLQNLPGTYRTKKVPYGYNYYDKNKDILDINIRSHGMHVAGTVGANGEIKGVAPEAQLLAMKVFSKDPDFPSTYDDIYMKAIDDALKLGVDVVNMSLGSTASFYQPNSAMDEMITNAREHGVIFSISAGNSAHSTDGAPNGHGYPSINNPDIGLVGAPSLNKDSISVASIENTHMQSNYIAYGEGQKAPYAISGSHKLAGEFTDIEFVDAGFGSPEDFEGKDLQNKVALMIRGAAEGSSFSGAFTEKISNAQNAGAAVAIVYNHEGGGEDLVSMQYPDGDGTIPAAFIGYSHGNAIKALADKKLSFPTGLIKAPNPNAWRMSDFTSWGTTPTLDMKPEITAPGGQIYSTLEDNNYGMMSGTSMAAPHLAGGAALVEQYVKTEHTNISTEEISEFSKKLLMNTAIPALDGYGMLYSPRRQGSGLMNLPGALTTPVTVVNKSDGEAKVQLRELDERQFSINLLATNHSDKEVNYDIEVDVLAEWIHSAGFSFLDVEPLQGVRVVGDKSISLGAGEIKEISVSVDFSDAIVPGIGTPIRDNMFIEGFVRLVAPTEKTVDGQIVEKYPSLVVPYVGFYGDWYGENSPRILDGMKYFGEYSYFQYAGMVNQNLSYMGFDPVLGYEKSINRLAISPDAIEEEANTEINPVLSFIRNAEEVQFNVLDKHGRVINRIKTENWVRKEFSNVENIWYSYSPDRAWDGKANNEVVEDGKYFYEIKAKPQNGQWQIYKYPVYVDTVAPEILNLSYEEGMLSWEAGDKGIGLSHFTLYANDEEVKVLLPNENGIYKLEMEIPEDMKIEVVAQDYAGNTTKEIFKQSQGNKPSIKFETPEPFSLYTKNSIEVKGNVSSENGVKSLVAYLEQDGTKLEPVDIKFNQKGDFNQVIEGLEDAVYTIRLVATDIFGQEYEIFRYFHVDTTKPVVTNLTMEVEDNQSGKEKQMPGGGLAIVLPGLGEAYHRDYLIEDEVAMNNFDKAMSDKNKEVYVKLDENVYVAKNGEPVDQSSIPALTYYNEDGFIEEYDADGNYQISPFKIVKFSMNVEENHGYFEVYVNGSQEYIQDESGLMEIIPFHGVIEFAIQVPEDIEEFEVKVIDKGGNETIITEK